MKKPFKQPLHVGSSLFLVLFALFSVGCIHFSVIYGVAGLVLCLVWRMATLHGERESRRQVQELMNNVEIEGGEIRPAVTRCV